MAHLTSKQSKCKFGHCNGTSKQKPDLAAFVDILQVNSEDLLDPISVRFNYGITRIGYSFGGGGHAVLPEFLLGNNHPCTYY